MDSKKDIRKRILDIRNRLTEKEWELKTTQIFQKTISHPLFIQAEEIFCYVDYRNEVGTRKLIEYSWNANKKVAVPKVSGDEMNFYYIRNFTDLKEGFRGIMEPDSISPANAKSALIIMPGAVFDANRNRIGYGKGFYDKYLHKHPNYHTIALAFACQIVSHIPSDKHDICPEVIITEDLIYEHTAK